jgi:serine/threonine protein kinase
MCRAIYTDAHGDVSTTAPGRTSDSALKEVCIEASRQVIAAILRRLSSKPAADVKCNHIVCSNDFSAAHDAVDCVATSLEHTSAGSPPVAEDPRVTDLSYFRSSTTFEGLCSSSFTMIRKLSSGINGDIFKYEWSRNGETTQVAVKKLRKTALECLDNKETNERCIHMNPRLRLQSNEDALAEIGVLAQLSKQPDLPLYLLKSLGGYSESRFTWLVTEYCDGGELFDVAAAGGLQEDGVRKYTWQMLQAVEYLHRHHIGHRDISLENVLLKGGVVRLMDYGMAVRSHSSSGTPLRYFREVGKGFYRAPECYVPTREETAVTVPAFANPGDVVMMRVPPNFLCEVRLPTASKPGATCLADVWGYAAAPGDIWSVAICMFILAFQCPLWQSARLSDRCFAHFYNSGENGVQSLVALWNKKQALSDEAMSMLADMLHPEPYKRPSAASCLNHTWFADFVHKQVELHSSGCNN